MSKKYPLTRLDILEYALAGACIERGTNSGYMSEDAHIEEFEKRAAKAKAKEPE